MQVGLSNTVCDLSSLCFPTHLEARKSQRVIKVPKGTSDYQATWIVDDEEENEDDDEDDLDSCDDDEDDADDMMEDGEDAENESQV